MWLWLLELIAMAGATYIAWTFRSVIQTTVTQHEKKILITTKNAVGSHINSLLQASGLDRTQSDIWWNRQWNMLGIIFLTTFVFSLYSGQFWWMSLPVLFPLFQYYVLVKKMRLRKNVILKRIPFVLDMLILNLQSGLDFVSSLEELVTMNDVHPLHDEIKMTLQGIRVGESRSQAFKNLGLRTQVSELTQLAGTIRQSDTMGSSLIELLRLQSQEIRYRIFKQAEAEAQKAPVKILIPMLLFIFPVVFIILFVPIGIQFFQDF